MWKASAIVGAVELLAYAAIAIVSMVRAGQGSGIWIPLLPVLWLVVAGRLWVVLRAADLLREVNSWQFVLVAGAFGFLFSIFVFGFLGGAASSGWNFYGWIICPMTAHIAAALLACRQRSGAAPKSFARGEEE